MTKNIKTIIQNDSGGENPDSHIHEDKLWELQFDDGDSTVLTRIRMLEFLTKGTVPAKTVHSFRKWDLTTTQGNAIRTWVVVYDDKSHVQLTNKDFYSLLSNGHRNRDEEELKKIELELYEKRNLAPTNPVLFDGPKTLTTKDEREELDEFREDTMRKHYFPV